jgi:2-C-methyl-D-erythritol 2,4-cyclodiphosphate synthase
MRVGWGLDAHRFSAAGRVLLAGVTADESRGVEATSDGDVLAHAVADAVLGAAALGDLGERFPSGHPASEGADSMELLSEVVALAAAAGFRVASVDVTVVAESVRIAPIRERIRRALAACLDVAPEAVSVKATTTDGMGWIGSGEGLAVAAVAVLEG